MKNSRGEEAVRRPKKKKKKEGKTSPRGSQSPEVGKREEKRMVLIDKKGFKQKGRRKGGADLRKKKKGKTMASRGKKKRTEVQRLRQTKKKVFEDSEKSHI